VPVLPVHGEADRAWRLSSWDRFAVPKPFARVRVAYGAPLEIGPGEAELTAALARAEAAMHEVERMARWPDGAAIPTG